MTPLAAAREWVRLNLGRHRSFAGQLGAAFEAGVAWSAQELGSRYLKPEQAEASRLARDLSALLELTAPRTVQTLETAFVIGSNYWRDRVTPQRSQKERRRLPTDGETRASKRPKPSRSRRPSGPARKKR